MLLSPACHYWAASASRTGKSLALGGSDTLIHVIDAAARHETALLTGHADDIVAVAFSPTEEHALISLARVARAETSAFDLFVWDVSAATKLAAATGQGVAFDARWAPDGASFVVACRGRCEVFDRRAASAATLSFAGDVVACCFSPTAAFVAAAAGVSVSVAAAAVSAGTPPTFAAHPERVNDVHWACGCVASAGDDGAVTLFDERTGALAKRIQAHGDICKTVRIADGVVLTGAEDRTARLFRLSGEEAVLRGHSAAVALVAHLPGGKTCLTASEDGSCRIWDYARAFAQDTAPGSDKAIAAVVFVEGGLIVADGGGVLRRFDDDGKKEIWHTEPLEAAHAAVTALAISGGLLAVAMYKCVPASVTDASFVRELPTVSHTGACTCARQSMAPRRRRILRSTIGSTAALSLVGASLSRGTPRTSTCGITMLGEWSRTIERSRPTACWRWRAATTFSRPETTTEGLTCGRHGRDTESLVRRMGRERVLLWSRPRGGDGGD